MHIAGEVFQHATATRMTHIPYKGVMPAVQDTISGQVKLAISALGLLVNSSRPGGTPEDAARDVRDDHARYARILTQFGIKAE